MQLVAFDWLGQRAETDTSVRAVVDVLGLPRPDQLTWSVAEPVEPLPGLVAVLDAHGDLPLVSDLDPYRLGTTKSDYGDRDTYGQHDPYVPRTRDDVDARLRESLVPGRLVLVVAPSKVGKTRTAFEAIRARWPQARLAAPDPSL